MGVTVHGVTGGLARNTPSADTGTGSDLVAQIAETTSDSKYP